MRIKIGPSENDYIDYETGDLFLQDRALLTLPDGLTVNGSLMLDNCISLRSLPCDICVRWTLSLSNCTSLQSLPRNLKVPSNLWLDGCTSLQSLPTDLHVGGSIVLGGNSLLLSNFPSCVYSQINFNLLEEIIVGTLDYDVMVWCIENGIDTTDGEFDAKPFPIRCPMITDPAQLMLYRLRWN